MPRDTTFDTWIFCTPTATASGSIEKPGLEIPFEAYAAVTSCTSKLFLYVPTPSSTFKTFEPIPIDLSPSKKNPETLWDYLLEEEDI